MSAPYKGGGAVSLQGRDVSAAGSLQALVGAQGLLHACQESCCCRKMWWERERNDGWFDTWMSMGTGRCPLVAVQCRR